MPKKPKREEVEGNNTWSEDQKEREYYYDDAHGYEAYDPEEGDEGAEKDAETGRRGDAENGS